MVFNFTLNWIWDLVTIMSGCLNNILKRLSWSLWVESNNIWIKNTPTTFSGFNESSLL